MSHEIIAQHKPRRSCLYMPASNARALEKAKGLDADVLIFDLEDSVAPEAKDSARAQVCDVVKNGGYGSWEIIIRINAMDTPWGKDDLKAICAVQPDGVLVPKIMSADDILSLSKAMDDLGAPENMKLWVMIEMPMAFLNLDEIAAASQNSRLSCFALGFNDLAKELRAKPDADRKTLTPAISQAVMAARALSILDSVYNDIADPAGFEQECRQGCAFGFDGKTLIHPTQIAPCNDIFAPSPSEIKRAQDIVAAFADPANRDKGVIKVDGQMTELLHREEAVRVLEIADAIASR